MRRLVALVTLLAALLPTAALAHPLGNFTVNRYARVELAADAVLVRYVVDMAEVPTFQEREKEEPGYPDAKAEDLRRGLQLTIDGRTVTLEVRSAEVELVPGQAGLPTMRIGLWLTAPMPDGATALHFRDGNFAGRIGWREMVVRGGEGVRIEGSTAPAKDLSDELRSYPEELLERPIDVGEARASFVVTGAAASAWAPAQIESAARTVAGGELGRAPVAVALLLAGVWGAMHALSPGHGKAVVAAYLVGSRGTARHALYLGLTVTTTHTIGIYGLGLITLFAEAWLVPEALYPWLSLASGAAVVAVGAVLLRGRVRAVLHELTHARGVEHHHHDHDHDHDHDHAPPERLTPRGLIALGIAGGLLPCPSALVLMLGAIALGQVAFGLALVAAFSLGLAGVLTAIGVVLVQAKGLVDRALPGLPRPTLLRWAPVGSALVVTALGAAMSAQALAQLGM